MKDRVPVNPGRVLITPENGSAAYYATMTRADNPTQEGTPLNKNSLLRDATAALFGLGADAVPDDVFGVLKTLIDGNAEAIANGVKIATGSYTGVENTEQVLTFPFSPKVVIIAPDVTSTLTCNASPLVAFQGGVGVPVYSNIVQKYSLVGNKLTLTATSASASYTWTAPYKYIAFG